ncbi:Histidine kinase-like ATPase domain-containing protein [Duganella sp. OV458]|nr:Histidine kinase-like ATPase domain-containing protein [Duganella sp. OV458]SDK29090.1 Anti-sigma regulatory factor (Ser/Thr protein kinase) [Duganella sp. OV510]
MNVLAHTAALVLAAQVAELRRATAWLHAEAGARVVPDEEIARLDLCLHEALANVLDHSGLTADAEVRLRLQVGDGCATLTLDDGGAPYDLTQAVVAARPLTLEDTEPGGLGVLMLRSQADQLEYEYIDGRNHLHITVRWSAA